MSHADDIQELLQRFVDDRDALDDDAYARLTAAVRESPQLAIELRDQLLIDDVLSQHLAMDRQRFDAQVQQRLADHLQTEEELNQQADELRSLALASLDHEHPGSRNSGYRWIALALVLALVVSGGIWQWQQAQANRLLARIRSVEGRVILRRFPHDNDTLAAADSRLRLGDRLIVGEDAAITLGWSDGTRLRLDANSVADLSESVSGKRLYLEHGDLTAVVAPQPPRQPMIFATPHADAIVRGTELSIHVQHEETRLRVAEGKVELVEHETHDTQLVAAAESARALPGQKVAKQAVTFPRAQQGLLYLFTAQPAQALVRSGGLMRPARLEPQPPGAIRNVEGELELKGGRFIADIRSTEHANQMRDSGEITIEAVLAADQPADDRMHIILSLELPEQLVLTLSQQNHELLLMTGPPGSTDGNHVVGDLPEFGKLTHVTIAYSSKTKQFSTRIDNAEHVGSLAADEAFLQGQLDRLAIGGMVGGNRDNDMATNWQGRVAGLAIYNRCLTGRPK